MRVQEIRVDTPGTGRRKASALAGLAPPFVFIPAGPSSRVVYAPVVTGGATFFTYRELARREGDLPVDEPDAGRRKWAHFEATYAPPLIFPPSIPQNRAVFAPSVTGPITMPVGPTSRLVNSPTVTVDQTLSLSGTISQRAVYAPVVALVTTLSPGAIAGGRAVYAPVVSGGPQYISLLTCPGKRQVSTPIVTGGAGGVRLFLSAVDQTSFLVDVENTFQIHSQTLGRWEATFDVRDPAGVYAPTLGQTVLILDGGARLFMGCISHLVIDRALSSNDITYHCTAVDKSGICDHRVVTGALYKTGVDVAQVILAIVSNYLNGEGITTLGVPQDGSLGTLGADLPLNFVTVTQAFDQLAQLSGTVWWVDVFGSLNFSSLANLPAAPFTLGEATRNWRGTQAGRGLQVTQTTQHYYNKIYAVSNLNIVPGASGSGGGGQTGFTENFTFTAGQNGVFQNSDGTVAGIRTSTAIGSVISLTVNGIAQTVYDFTNNFKNQQRTGSNDFVWVYAAGNTQLTWTFGGVPAGATIVLQYVPYVASSTSIAQYGQAIAPLDPQGHPLGTCGSGIYEGVVQVKDLSDQPSLNAIAAAMLARIGGVPTVATFQTDQPGLKPGQLLTVDIPLSGIPNTHLLITKASGVYILGLGTTSTFRWDIECTTNLDPGNWLKWFERLIGRTDNALPVLQYEDSTFVLGPGSNIIGGQALTNPYIVKRTGLAIEIKLAAAIPPIDETLVLQITRNGSIIATVQMPPTTLSNQLITVPIPKSNQLYLYKDDVLNVSSSYLVTGSNPTGAQALTLVLRWAI